MSAFRVTAVHEGVRDWNSTQGGPMKEYTVDIKDSQDYTQTVAWSRKPTSKPPEVGMEFEAELKHIDFPPGQKLTNVQFAPGQGGGGSAGGGKSDTWKPHDPRTQAVIQRQAEQNRAIQFLAQTKTFTDMDAFSDGDEGVKLALNLVFRVADAFHKDSERAGDRVTTQSSPAPVQQRPLVRKDIERTGQSDLPGDGAEFTHPTPSPVPDEDPIPW